MVMMSKIGTVDYVEVIICWTFCFVHLMHTGFSKTKAVVKVVKEGRKIV
jgi:hypothetical protein